ncbi:hypothetical protein [Novosphingobium sp. B 225]|uniref:hypothetical protein n=1 Tax=Novosphingobium sp. B 225 TaxID=1961849 RepID=UPI001124FAFA|nr:hypothetical protein [Novosphingobium sp. B 225]
MVFAASLATVGEFIGVTKGVKDLIDSGRVDKRGIRPVLHSLEKLYFTPNGILGVLKCIADGEKPDHDLLSAALIEFNDGEWAVQNAAQSLDFDALPAAHFPLRLRSSLQAAAYGKLSLRRDLQDALNLPFEDLVIDRHRAVELVSRIKSLNSELESLDEQLR